MTVGASGPLDAALVCVGRDPGYHEMLAGRPFVGPAGKLLDRAMQTAGVPRATALITNVIGTRPTGDRWEAHSALDIEQGVTALRSRLNAAPRTLIVALGEQAALACLGHDPRSKLEQVLPDTITNLRGYVFSGPFGPVLIVVHPAFILRTWHPWWATFCWDWQKAARLLHSGPDQRVRTQTWASSETVINDWITTTGWGTPHGPQQLAVDTERGAETPVACVGVAADATSGLTIPYTTAYIPFVRELLASDIPKIMQNGQYDVTELERVGCPVRRWEHDIMLLWHAVEPMLAGKVEQRSRRTEKSLRFLASLLTDEPFYKSYDFADESEKFLLCAKDARITFEIYEKLSARLQ